MCVCVQEIFSVSSKIFHCMENLCIRVYSGYHLPHLGWTNVLIVPYVVSRMSILLGCSSVHQARYNKDTNFGRNNANHKKINKRVIILMLWTSEMYKKFFILCLKQKSSCIRGIFSNLRLINSHPRVYYFYFMAQSAAVPKCGKNLVLKKI